MYDIGFQRYIDYKFRVIVAKTHPLQEKDEFSD